MIYQSGPGYRIWELPDGSHYEQRMQKMMQFVRLSVAASDVVQAGAEQLLLDEVSSRAAADTEEPLVKTEFIGWREEELVDDSGFVFGWVLVGEAESYYWPRTPWQEES